MEKSSEMETQLCFQDYLALRARALMKATLTFPAHCQPMKVGFLRRSWTMDASARIFRSYLTKPAGIGVARRVLRVGHPFRSSQQSLQKLHTRRSAGNIIAPSVA